MSSIAATAVAAQQAQTNAQLAAIMQKQQAEAQQSVVTLLEQSAQNVKAATPAGVGGAVDVSA